MKIVNLCTKRDSVQHLPYILALDLCSPDPCRYGTHCIQNDEESYQCMKNLCQPTPCQNGGKCIVVNNEHVECACPKGWKGKHCERKIL